MLLFITAWLANEGIKATSVGNTDIITEATSSAVEVGSQERALSLFAHYLVERVSVYYYSVISSAEYAQGIPEYGRSASVVFPLSNMVFRLDYLLGNPFGVDRPESGKESVQRMNVHVISKNTSNLGRSGTAPGVIAAFNYPFFFPLNIIFCALFLAWVARIFNGLLWRHREQVVSVLGLLISYMFLEHWLQSPFDLLLIFDGSAIQVGLLYGIYLHEKSSFAKHQASSWGTQAS